MQFRKTKQGRAIYAYAQPYRDPNVSHHEIPMWQKDMASWCNKRMIFSTCEFKDYRPRKGFMCSKYFEDETLLEWTIKTIEMMKRYGQIDDLLNENEIEIIKDYAGRIPNTRIAKLMRFECSGEQIRSYIIRNGIQKSSKSDSMKVCVRCGEMKPTNEFDFGANGARVNICRPCLRKRAKERKKAREDTYMF